MEENNRSNILNSKGKFACSMTAFREKKKKSLNNYSRYFSLSGKHHKMFDTICTLTPLTPHPHHLVRKRKSIKSKSIINYQVTFESFTRLGCSICSIPVISLHTFNSQKPSDLFISSGTC